MLLHHGQCPDFCLRRNSRLGGRFDALTGRVEFALNARNLLDSQYYETAGSNFQIFPGTPRDVVFTIRVAR